MRSGRMGRGGGIIGGRGDDNTGRLWGMLYCMILRVKQSNVA